MKTHTIRWNKDKTRRIIKFTSDFEKQLLAAHPQAAAVLIDKLLRWLDVDTGRRHSIDCDQGIRLNGIVDACNKLNPSPEARMINNWLVSGVRILDADVTTILSALSLAYGRIYDSECLHTPS